MRDHIQKGIMELQFVSIEDNLISLKAWHDSCGMKFQINV